MMMTDIVPVSPAVLRGAQRMIFPLFLQLAFAHLNGGTLMMPNWHHEAIAFELERVRRRINNRLIISMPPRHLKSISTSVAGTAFLLGLDPRLNIMCVSYSKGLAAKFAQQCLDIMESPWYRALFPGTRIKRRAAMDFTTTMGGGRLATSIEGGVTGRGGDIIIVDDPGKPEEAMSEVMRTNVADWYRSSLRSRLNNQVTGAIILVMQRLHEDDLAGIVMRKGSWHNLSLPAIATEDADIPLLFGRVHHRRAGDVLHPELMPRSELEKIRQDVGTFVWNAQYQQVPIPEEGNLVKREWVQRYNANDLPRREGQIVQSWDTASGLGDTNDYSACVTALLWRQKLYILHVYRGRHESPSLLAKIRAHAQAFNAQTLLIENASSGRELIPLLREEIFPGVPSPLPRTPSLDKKTRFAVQSSRFESGQVLLPQEADWLGTFEHELFAFPGGRHDDQVDALSQLLNWFGRQIVANETGMPEIVSSYNTDGYENDDDLDDDIFANPYRDDDDED